MENDNGENMGRLIIDGNSVFEIDEKCLKKRKVPKDCNIEKYLNLFETETEKRKDKKSGDG